MKFTWLPMGLLAFSAVSGFASFWNSPASAQCVVADVSIQAAIHGSERPAQQTNDVEMISEEPCTGNTSVSTNRQIQVGGTGEVRQERTSRHHIRSSQESRTGTGGPTVAVPVQVQVDVFNPAERLRH